MAYSELVKNFGKIRDYMREFYVYGFKSRDEYTGKSPRSYDDERRRLESWLGDYMRFRQTADGKNVFLSIDSRVIGSNPLFKAWKTKSFTDGEIILHFILFDLLHSPEIGMSLSELTAAADEYLAGFDDPRTFDESTVRKKLKEYENEGIIVSEKRGKTVVYRRTPDTALPSSALLGFFSEVSPCGVVGSFLLDKKTEKNETFAFKHHYITSTIDSDVLCEVFDAMRQKRTLTVEFLNRRKETVTVHGAVPLRVRISAQSGRQHLMLYVPRFDRITSFRVDKILSVEPGEVCEDLDKLRAELRAMEPHLWGVSTGGRSGGRSDGELEHVEFTVRYEDDEPYIPQRLEREKRCGTVELLPDGRAKFSADVYDSSELIPWIRTFLCRITEVRFSEKEIEKQFLKDMECMYAQYGIGGEDG